MKNNVDLTENRIFSRSNFFEDVALGTLTLAMITGSKFPWDTREFKQINSDDELDLDHQRRSIIALGDKKQRAEIVEYRKMDSRSYCDCCGSAMNKIPWDRYCGLCRKCNDYYENKDNDKCLWREKEVIQNAVIRTV